MKQALEGVRIVDFTQMMLGPFGTQFLGDMGADIIKIERPVTGEWERGLAAMGQLLGGDSPSGPYLKRPGQDLLIQALSGYAAQNGKASEPPVPSACSVMDASTALTLALSIMVALFCRERTGIGQKVDVSLFNTAIAIQCQELVAHMNLPVRAERSAAGIGAPWLSAPFGVYAAADGYVAISINPLPAVGEALAIPE